MAAPGGSRKEITDQEVYDIIHEAFEDNYFFNVIGWETAGLKQLIKELPKDLKRMIVITYEIHEDKVWKIRVRRGFLDYFEAI